jgi:hypothetical protein
VNDPYKVLERQLGDAVRRRVGDGARRRRPRWNRGVLSTVAVIGVLGTGAATAGVVLGPDDQPKNQVRQALFAGQRAAQAAPACREVEPRAARLVDDPVPTGVLDQLGVLRRPVAPRDHVPLADLGSGGGEVLARSVRVARASDGWSYRLYLSRRSMSFAGGRVADPLGCVQARRDASIAAAAHFDAGVRAQVTKAVDRELAFAADMSSGKTLALEFDEMRPNGRRASGGGTIIRNDTIPAIASMMGNYRRRYVSLGGLVTDGVASVRVLDASGSPRHRPVTIPVTDNVYHALMSQPIGPRMTVEWRDHDDRVIRRMRIR